MTFKNSLFVLFLLFSLFTLQIKAQTTPNIKLYGNVRSDFYFNTRTNEQGLDGLFNIIPRPMELNQFNEDINAIPNSEMLNVATLVGINLDNMRLLNSNTTAKIEFDFAGNSANYYLIRLRQAFIKFNWLSTELLIGQTWHPLWGNVIPKILALNGGSPFQPFNRSPQIRLSQNIFTNTAITAVASYQMQYLSQGPVGSSASYMKNATIPDLYFGIESKNSHWTNGIGIESKTLRINHQLLTSACLEAHSQYIGKQFQIRAKSLLGQNMSDYLMIGGYAVNGTDSKYNEDTYTNLNTSTSWFNIVYGNKIQYSIFAGYAQNLGSTSELITLTNAKYQGYGYGFYSNIQQLLQSLYRVAVGVSYNINNFKIGSEIDMTNAEYGNINKFGLVVNPYHVMNFRAAAHISYSF